MRVRHISCCNLCTNSVVTIEKSRNVQLEEENILLRHRLNRASTSQGSSAAAQVDAKIKAFQFEEERDQAVETLQLHKKKYNKLHDAYLEKVKRCKALEEMFKRQKTLTGLVMKSAIEQRNSGSWRFENTCIPYLTSFIE